MTRTQRQSPFPAVAVAALFASALATGAAFAQYKVIGPDGKVTYTDRPDTQGSGNLKQVPTTTGGSTGTDLSGLPFALRQVAQRYPVTLYTASGCGPCDNARQFLRLRGVPFSERTVNTAEDGAALSRTTGKTDLPAATIGSQVLNGFQAANWTSYIDAAGYPQTSQLPAGYSERAATPLTTPSPVAAPPAPAPRPVPSSPSPAPAPAPSGIRF